MQTGCVQTGCHALDNCARQDSSFPENTEIESTLTFTTDDPGKANFVRQVTPTRMPSRARAPVLHRTSRPGFTPRASIHARLLPDAYRDIPLRWRTLDQQFIIRHRLQREIRLRARLRAQAPIQYYVIVAHPNLSVRPGGRRTLWDQAFQAAGWAPGTFRVELLPADADPMDIRYNIIQWVHRYTRGWSYGSAVVDPALAKSSRKRHLDRCALARTI